MTTSRQTFIAFCAVVLALPAVSACRGWESDSPPVHLNWNMDTQEKGKAYRKSDLFADGRAMRTPPEGTVAQGFLKPDSVRSYGMVEAADGKMKVANEFPGDIAGGEAFVARGRDRYGIYCSPCHSSVGDGKGVTSKYGMTATASLHDPRIVRMADGEIFHTISVGKNTMMGYADKLEPADRWAVIAYVRALQRARLATKDEVPADIMATLKK